MSTLEFKRILIGNWNEANPVGSPVRAVSSTGRIRHGRVGAPAAIEDNGECFVQVDNQPCLYPLARVIPDTDQAAFETAQTMREKCVMECARIEAAERRCGEDAGRSEIEREAHKNKSFAAGELKECIRALSLSGG